MTMPDAHGIRSEDDRDGQVVAATRRRAARCSVPLRLAEWRGEEAQVLITRVSEADTDHMLFEELHRTISPRLRRFVRRAEPAEADDIIADVWYAISAYLPRFRGDADGFEALVFTIARRRINDHRRRRATRRTASVAHESLPDRVGRDQPDTEAVDQLRLRATVEELLRTLTAPQFDVVVLRVLRGLSVEQVAAILGRSEGAVRILQHRALKRLRS
jgi:RNA polymerase sigma-70 factor (ECF subfamily)